MISENEMLYGKDEEDISEITVDCDTDAVTVENSLKEKSLKWIKDYLKAFGCAIALCSIFLPLLIISIKIAKYFVV